MRWPTRVRLILPGKIKFPFVKEGASFYQKRLNHYFPFGIEEKKVPKGKDQAVKEKEGEIMLKALGAGSYVIALDERGKSFDSLSFARFFQDLLEKEREIVFLIGGPFGLSEKALRTARLRLSLSNFTLGHEIALLVLLEQLYRAASIVSGEPYHK